MCTSFQERSLQHALMFSVLFLLFCLFSVFFFCQDMEISQVSCKNLSVVRVGMSLPALQFSFNYIQSDSRLNTQTTHHQNGKTAAGLTLFMNFVCYALIQATIYLTEGRELQSYPHLVGVIIMHTFFPSTLQCVEFRLLFSQIFSAVFCP